MAVSLKMLAARETGVVSAIMLNRLSVLLRYR
jgi:hypothetical protein